MSSVDLALAAPDAPDLPVGAGLPDLLAFPVELENLVVILAGNERMAVRQPGGGGGPGGRHLPAGLAALVVLDHLVVAVTGDQNVAVGQGLQAAVIADAAHRKALQLLALAVHDNASAAVGDHGDLAVLEAGRCKNVVTGAA